MKAPIFSEIEIATLMKAVAYLQANKVQELVDDFNESDCMFLTSEYDLNALETKLNLYISIQNDNPNTVNILNSTIQDWRLSEGYKESDMKPDHCGKYSLNIEQSKATGQIFFSVYNREFDKHPKDIPRFGLNGLIEIRDGVPAVSLGINPDENVIHIMSNNSNELAVIPENDAGIKTWLPVEFCEAKYKGLCFQVDDFDTLMETRTLLANEAFRGFDFGERVVKNDNGWEIEDTHWSKTVFFENPADGSDPLNGHFKLTFVENGTHIISKLEE